MRLKESAKKQWSLQKHPLNVMFGNRMLVSYLVLLAQSTTKDYIRVEHILHTISKLFISQVILLQVMFDCLFFSLFIFRGHSTREPASNRVTDFILRAYTGIMN